MNSSAMKTSETERNVTEDIERTSTPGPTIHRIQIPAVADITTSESDTASVIPSNRNRNLSPAKYQRAGSERRPSETRHSIRHLSVRTAPSYLQNDIAKDEIQAIYKLFDALAVFKRTNIEEIKQIIKAGKELSTQRSVLSRLKHLDLMYTESESTMEELRTKDKQLIKLNQGRDWKVEHEQLEMRLHDLQWNYDKMKYESQVMFKDKTILENEIETLRSTLKRTKNEFLDKTNEMSTLKKQVELMDKESKLLKAQLQEKDKQLLNKKQGKCWNVDPEQLENMENDFQRKLEKVNGECQEMVMAKAKLEIEVDTIRSKLRKTEQELSEKTSEISGLKARFESMEDESKSLKAQLQEKDMLLPKPNTGRNWNWEFEQLDIRYKDLQGKFNKIKDDSRAMEFDKCTLENINEKLRSMLRKTEQELSEQTSEISKLKKRNESLNKESESLKTQLQEKDMMLLKQNQGINRIAEYEQLELRHKDLQREFDKIKYESQAMALDKNKLENENQKLRSMLQKTEQEFSQQRSEMTRLKKHVESVVEESESLNAQLQEKERQQLKQNQGRNLNVEYEQLEMRHSDLQRKFDQIEDEARALMVDKTKLENDNKKLSAVLRKTEQESLERKNEISKLKKRVENMDRELESFKAHLQQKERQLQEQILSTTKAYAEKDDALTRLSHFMGQQMSEGNPNITYLSDQNRPSKLGERYSELFDNEWTNAFEVLTGEIGKHDKEAIEVLRTLLLESYMRALDFSISQMTEAEYKLSGSTKGVGPECKRLLKEARKHIDIKEADSLLENVLEVTLSKIVDRRYIRETTLRVFAKECFMLCWFMSIQDLPVVLVEDPNKGSRFDTNIYKHYINSGDTVDYVVWPALLLHKGGPLLTKGVAQPFVRPGSD